MPSIRVNDYRASGATRNEDKPDSPTVKQTEGINRRKEMNTYISEVVGVIEKWMADNAGTPPKEQDIKYAFAEGFDDAVEHGLIRSAKDGDGYVVANFNGGKNENG